MKSVCPVVSVIIPTFNRRHLLQITIESVLAQTYPAVEIIVVDDGSTDGTGEMLTEYGARIRVIHQANQGGTVARNTGIRAASGEFLTFLDHDDLMLPTKLERQVALLRAHPEAGVCHCRWFYIDGQGAQLDRIGPLPAGDMWAALVIGCFLWSGAPVVRRACIEQVGLFDTHIWSSDWDMWLRLAQAGCRFVCVQELLGAYRIMPDSTMSDVWRTEEMDSRILDKVYASPQLPTAIRAVKDRAYATWRFWLSRRYYAIGCGEDACRNLALALRLFPGLLEDRAGFLDTLCSEALDVRISDPFAFIDRVFAFLPSAAEPIRSAYDYAVSRVHVGVALRQVARREFEAGQRSLAEAVRLYPAMLDQPDDFVQACVACAVRLPVKADTYVQDVLDHLPAEAASLGRVRGRLLADAGVASAFEHYFAGNRQDAGRELLRALRYRPAWIRNRGVLAVLARSLPDVIVKRGA